MDLKIADAREYVFPLFLLDADETHAQLNDKTFLGTAFFVSKKGDALTAAHVIPDPQNIPPGKRLVAAVQVGAETKICWINRCFKYDGMDAALIHVNVESPSKYFELGPRQLVAGDDVVLVGIPEHEVWKSGKEMRLLKGHVSMVRKPAVELSVAIPAGMSGSPVFVGSSVVAVASGEVASDQVVEYFEEVEKISDRREEIRITKVVRMNYYGLVCPVSLLNERAWSKLDGKRLCDLIAARNTEDSGSLEKQVLPNVFQPGSSPK